MWTRENRFELPDLGIGVGLRTVHYAHILAERPAVDWFEIISDNYIHTSGRPLLFLDHIAAMYPIVMHGVSLSIGSTDPIDFAYLRELKDLKRRTRARWISDHLCWTGVAGRSTHDLLPLPYSGEMLRHIARRVRTVQDFLGERILLENPATYAGFVASTMTEWDFVAELAAESDCGLLLDVNNVFVSAYNHGFSAEQYIDAMPVDRVVQMHVAGHTNEGTHIIDTHSGRVADPVWELLARARRRGIRASTMLEWDADIPDFKTVHEEALKARFFMQSSHRDSRESLNGNSLTATV
jgi:uncharacterized protein (UPF0276 family)